MGETKRVANRRLHTHLAGDRISNSIDQPDIDNLKNLARDAFVDNRSP